MKKKVSKQEKSVALRIGMKLGRNSVVFRKVGLVSVIYLSETYISHEWRL